MTGLSLKVKKKKSSAFLGTCELLNIGESQQIAQAWIKTFPVIEAFIFILSPLLLSSLHCKEGCNKNTLLIFLQGMKDRN